MPSSTEPKITSNDEFHLRLGLCITAWAAVEDQLFQLCHKILNSTEQRTAIVYYRTPTLDSRLKLVDELVLSTLPKPRRKDGGHEHPDVKSWVKLRKQIEGQLNARRRIAHHPVSPRHAMKMRVTKEKWGELIKSLKIESLGVTSWLEIYASEAERLRGRDEHTIPLKIDDLITHCAEVQGLSDRLEQFLSETLARHLK